LMAENASEGAVKMFERTPTEEVLSAMPGSSLSKFGGGRGPR
jgi:hypothetical protein